MGRIGVTYEEVVQAAQETQGKGKSPTVDNVRLILGSGSKSTIARHLRDWRNQQGLVRGSDGAIPSELLGLVKGLWERLRDSVEQKAYDYQCESDEKVKQIHQQLTQTQQHNAVLQEQCHKLEEKLHQQTKDNSQLQDVLIFEQQDKAKLFERASALESHRQEQQSEIERLHQLLKHVQHNLEHYQSATQQQRQEQSLLMEKQRNEYEQKISQFQQQVASLTTEKSIYQAKFEQVHLAYDKLEANYEVLNETTQKTKTELDTLSIVYGSLQQEQARLAQLHQKQAQDLELKNHTTLELQVKLGAHEDKITLLEKTLLKADDKIQTLRDDLYFQAKEKVSLEGQLKQLQACLP